jgi:dihydroxyacetone kinase-like protein
MKKLINAPSNAVREAAAGLAEAHADLLSIQLDPLFLSRRVPKERGRVALVSGGGSGHEPMHAGYVGYGMLDAACPGDVFTSPTPDQIEAATRAVDAGGGVLHVVKNYTGDVMNFDMARELCQAGGIAVQAVLINDDVAVQDSLFTAGRRGTGTTIAVEKMCGAAAERGMDLAAVSALGREINACGRSMGMALTSCTVPAVGRPTFEIGEGDMEIGVGIHGEPGRTRMPLKSAAETVELLGGEILSDLPFRPGDEAIAIVSGLGGTPLLELYIVYHEVERVCSAKGVGIVRRLVGNSITSLDMAGFSLTLVKVRPGFLDLWDFPVQTPGLRWGR